MKDTTKQMFLVICGLGLSFLVGAAISYTMLSSTELERTVYDATKEAITETEVHPYTCDCSYESTVVTELIQSLANKNDELWEMYLACSEVER